MIFCCLKWWNLHPYLLSFLTKKLNNGFITLNIQIYTEPENGQENKRLFTAKDKFDHFVEINPAVGELKALFGLEIEWCNLIQEYSFYIRRTDVESLLKSSAIIILFPMLFRYKSVREGLYTEDAPKLIPFFHGWIP